MNQADLTPWHIVLWQHQALWRIAAVGEMVRDIIFRPPEIINLGERGPNSNNVSCRLRALWR